MDYVSPKDYKDIVFAVKEDFDFIAASFVRTAADVKELRDILHEHGGDDIKIIAKIENHQESRISTRSLKQPMVSWLPVVTWVLRFRLRKCRSSRR